MANDCFKKQNFEIIVCNYQSGDEFLVRLANFTKIKTVTFCSHIFNR